MNSTISTSRLLITRVEAAGRRSMSSTAKVWVDKNTRVICQGFTGKQVRKQANLNKLGRFISSSPLAIAYISF